jgi:hypothetical protein
MAFLEIQLETEQSQGKHSPDVLPRGEGAQCEKQLIPPGISSDSLRNPPDISPAGHREFLRKRRFLAKMEPELQAHGLPGQEAAKEFILHLCRRSCRSCALLSLSGAPAPVAVVNLPAAPKRG